MDTSVAAHTPIILAEAIVTAVTRTRCGHSVRGVEPLEYVVGVAEEEHVHLARGGRGSHGAAALSGGAAALSGGGGGGTPRSAM